MAAPNVVRTPIDGLLVLELDVRSDNRGWFKENWQRAKMVELGLPDFDPVQQNVSYNATAGATRGIHAEPWDKFVSLASGRIFGAWVDLRPGAGFGTTFTLELGPTTAVFVPRGVGNAFQTLEDSTAYSYLVNEHWSPAAKDSYTFVNLGDEVLGIDWPIPLDRAELSEADQNHPRLHDVTPMPERGTLVLGAAGQLGRAVLAAWPGAVGVGRDELDLTDPDAVAAYPWDRFGLVVNAAAYTAVDRAETPSGRRDAWAVNVSAVRQLVMAARRHRLTLVHVSSDYVFDGSRDTHTEDEPVAPLGVYGQTKAAGDALVSSLERHYLLRTSWVIGDGGNFVRTMAGLADRGISPGVVDDQVGRLTFTTELVRAVGHLLAVEAPYGTYNLTNAGPSRSWADIAATVFSARGRRPDEVRRVSTEEYGEDKDLAPRPRTSTLSLDKITATGFVPTDADVALKDYLQGLPPA